MRYEYGYRIRELRIERGLSQVELSNATHISQSSISTWEIGNNMPTADAIIILAKYFNVSADYLLGLKD